MASIFHASDVTVVTSGVTNAVKDNILPALGLLAFIVGISIVMAILDVWQEKRDLDKLAERWRR